MRPHSRPVLILALLLLSAAPAAAAEIQFFALIDGAHARIPTLSNAKGVGTFTLNDAQTELAFSITFSPWLNNESFSHIHIDSIAGGSDGVIFDLDNGPIKVGIMPIKNPLFLNALLTGHLYVNVHSATYPQGAVAGYIQLGTPARAATWGRLKALFR
jgi:hypothetical protein